MATSFLSKNGLSRLLRSIFGKIKTLRSELVALINDADQRQTEAQKTFESDIENALDSYLPKTGGTITGPITSQCGHDTKLIFDNTDGDSFTQISFRENGTEYAKIVANSVNIDILGKPVRAQQYLATTTGLCTNLNADFLDGYNSSKVPGANLIPVADENAHLPVKAIKTTPFKVNIYTPGWYRVAQGNGINNITLDISRNWNADSPEVYRFEISVFRTNARIIQLSGGSTTNIIDKIRVLTKSGSNFYIDIHYNKASRNEVWVSGMSSNNTVFQTPAAVDEIQTGFSSKEFEVYGPGFKTGGSMMVGGSVTATSFIGKVESAGELSVELLTGGSLNDWIKPGLMVFFVAGGMTVADKPVTDAGYLEVLGYDTTTCSQTFTTVTGEKFRRVCYTGVWTDWEKMIDSADIAVFEDSQIPSPYSLDFMDEGEMWEFSGQKNIENFDKLYDNRVHDVVFKVGSGLLKPVTIIKKPGDNPTFEMSFVGEEICYCSLIRLNDRVQFLRVSYPVLSGN